MDYSCIQRSLCRVVVEIVHDSLHVGFAEKMIHPVERAGAEVELDVVLDTHSRC